MEQEKLLQKKKILIEELRFFHDFCLRHHLRYFCIGGTAIGVLRHGGFIPWDDDIDVGMPRPDFERFVELARSEGLEEYRLLHPETDDEYYQLFLKIADKNSTLIETKDKHCNIGVSLDIFPIDGAPSNKKEQANLMSRIVLMRTLFQIASEHFSLGDVLQTLCSKKWKEGLLILFTRLGRKRLRKWLYTRVQRLTSRIPFDEAKTLTNFYGSYNLKEFFPKEWMGTPQIAFFEGEETFLMEKVDLYLRHIFNNYMELPPVEERVTHHVAYRFELK